MTDKEEKNKMLFIKNSNLVENECTILESNETKYALCYNSNNIVKQDDGGIISSDNTIYQIWKQKNGSWYKYEVTDQDRKTTLSNGPYNDNCVSLPKRNETMDPYFLNLTNRDDCFNEKRDGNKTIYEFNNNNNCAYICKNTVSQGKIYYKVIDNNQKKIYQLNDDTMNEILDLYSPPE